MVTRIKTFLRNDMAVAFIIALVWQLLMTIIGSMLLPDPAGKGPLQHLLLWDGGWYLNIINEQYRINPASSAFYPLFPLTVSLAAGATFHVFSYQVVGLVINTIALGFALAGLISVARSFGLKTRVRYLPVALLLASPAAFFLHQFYGEAIFAAIGFWAYAFALQKKWLAVGLLLVFLTAARLPALLFVGLCGLEFLRAYDWNIRKALNPSALYFLLAPLGFIAYGLYLLVVRGDFFAMFSAYHTTTDWIYQSFNPNFLSPIARGCYHIILALTGRLPLTSDLLVNTAIPLFSLAILLICSLYLVFTYRGKGIPLGIAGLVSLVFFTLNNNLVSIHRYTLPCLGIYIALTLICTKYSRLRPLVIATAAITAGIQLLLIIWLFTTDKFVG